MHTSLPTSCHEWQRLLSTIYPGDLLPPVQAALDQHIASCAACKALADDYQAIDTLLRVVSDRALPTDLPPLRLLEQEAGTFSQSRSVGTERFVEGPRDLPSDPISPRIVSIPNGDVSVLELLPPMSTPLPMPSHDEIPYRTDISVAAHGQVALAHTPETFARLVEETQGHLNVYIRHLVGEPALATDIAQTVYLNAWRCVLQARSPFLQTDEPAAQRKWLFREASWRASDHMRARTRARWMPLEIEEANEIEEARLTQLGHFFQTNRFEDSIAEGEALRQALDTILQRDAACILLTVVEGFSIAELVEIMGFPSYAAAKKTLQRALKCLRKAYLDQNGSSDGPEAPSPNRRSGQKKSL